MECDVVGNLPMSFTFLRTYEALTDRTCHRHFLVETAELNTSWLVEMKNSPVHPLQNVQGILQNAF